MTEEEFEGNVVFPIPEDGITLDDAVATLADLELAKVVLTKFNQGGNSLSGNLTIELLGMVDDQSDCWGKFFRASLKDELEGQLDGMDDDIFAERKFDPGDEPFDGEDNWEKSVRLAIRLLRAYHEWEEVDAKMTAEELRINPLPAARSVISIPKSG
jgi:hypothetical protein